ncbi:MAG: VWA domain-containing protein [Gammaproteobacteria bacterium]|nr:VWA domain-containing protein [Gammaproteobacteria bacterium]
MKTSNLPNKASTLLVAVILMMSVGAASGQVRKPLVQDGKTALYQRVIAAPGAMLLADPSRPSETRGVPPFSNFHVYDRRDDGGRQWVQVGTDSNGTIDGWVDGDQVFDWNQTLTVAFRDPAQHERVLLFGNRDSLKKIVDDGDAATYRKLRSQVADGDVAGTPVVAVQPDYNVDIRRNFYLVPILDHEDVLIGGRQSRLLRVASVPLQDSALITETYRTGIVFVIDSTISMKPYIDATRAVMQRVYRSIDDEKLGNRVSYGLVEFRDNTDAVPGLGFVTRIVADLGGTGEQFLSRIKDVQPAPISSQGFNEDAYAGVQEAIRTVDWSDYYARYVVVITDAGPRDASDPLSATGLDAASLQRLAADKDIAVGVFHLKTPASRDNHGYAEGEYRRLATVPDVGEFYYPVQAGDVNEFESALSALTDVLTAHVRAAAAGQPPALARKSAAESDLEAFQKTVDRLGYGLRMRYLQERTGEGVPSLFNAWMIDRDFDAPEERALDVRVLLTRDQLSDLHEVLRQVLITAEEGTLAPDDFLDELKSLAASVSRDPQAARTATRTVGGESLADLGYMREYLEGLPYQSEVMYLDLSIWEQWPAQRQFEFVNQLDSKVAYYRALHDNIDLWVSLDGEAVDGDSVYPLLLEALP